MNKLKERLQNQEKLIGTEVDLCDSCISELVAKIGFDFIWIDTEHEAMDYHMVLEHIIAVHSGGTSSLVRIPWNEPYLAKRILEMGPDGIIFPMVNTAAEAKKAIDSCLYPPLGTRGFGPKRACGYAINSISEYIETAPDLTCRFIQIEHVEGVRNLDEILRVPYLDGIVIGPCDLSGSIGKLNDIYCEENLNLIDTIIKKCCANRIPVGVAIGDVSEDVCHFWFDRGVQFISGSNDMLILMSAEKKIYDTMRTAVSYATK